MSPEAKARILAAFEIEHRAERAYDEQDAGHVVHPNATLVDSMDRGFLGAATREVLCIHEAPRQEGATA